MAAGDVVNTAARLQAAAPLNGVLVGEQTHRATAQSIDYRDAHPVTAKGKSEPVHAWEAVQARSRLGVDVSQQTLAPLVGRSRELALLVSTLERVRDESSPQLVTLVGVPGIGKSRLVYELMRAVDEQAGLVRWRQGRSLPYGEGVTFWALAEIVKAQAGILESDPPARTEEKLRGAVAEVCGDASEAEWLERQLRPLAGLAEEGASSQEEAFAAWRRLLEAMAEERPLVLVFEDLHWADDALLDFVDQLVERARSVPLLVLATARPELLQQRSGWGGGKSNALTVSLSPLSDAETTRLVESLVERPVAEAQTREALLARAGGNPLYAEQYARILVERGDVLGLPETVQGIIAARLDTLSEQEKGLLQDAAVIGKVFWLGAVEAVDGVTRWQAEELLHTLERKEFVGRSRASSVATETEYAFRHLLIRDIAYGQIPRAARSHKHRRAATWIESLGRPEDQAEMLAHHYLQALQLAEAAGLDSSQLAEPARRALRDAGDRAAALYAAEAAERFYDAALRLWPPDAPERAELLFRRAVPVGHHVGGGDLDRLAQARDALLAVGEHGKAAEAEMLIAQTHWIEGRRGLSDEYAERSLTILGDSAPSRSRAWVLARMGTRASLMDDRTRAIEIAQEAQAVSEQVGWLEGTSDSLSVIGLQRVFAGEPDGIAQLERSVELARASSAGSLARVSNALAVGYQVVGDLELAYRTRLESLHAAERIGSEPLLRWFQGVLADHHYRRGEWAEATSMADELLAGVEAGSPSVIAWQAFAVRAEMRLASGDLPGAVADADAALTSGRTIDEVQAVCFVLAAGAHVFAAASERARSLELAGELLDSLRSGVDMQFAVINLPLFASAARRLDLSDELAAALDGHSESPWMESARAYLAGDFVAAADILGRIGTRPDEAETRLQSAGQLIADGRAAEADAQLERALAFYRSVSAMRAVRECEALRQRA